MVIILDTFPASSVAKRPGKTPTVSDKCREWVLSCESAGHTILVPAICYYEVLRELKSRQEPPEECFPPGATEEQIAAANARLPQPIPLLWQQALKFSNEFNISTGFVDLYFHGTNDIDMSNAWPFKFVQELSPPHLIIANEASGDAFALDISRQTPEGDCPVVWVCHDDENSEWETIPAMFAYLLGSEQDDEM